MYFSVLTDHFDVFPVYWEFLCKVENHFSKWFFSCHDLSLSKFGSSQISLNQAFPRNNHTQVTHILKKPLLDPDCFSFSPLPCCEEVNYSFFSILTFLGPQGLVSRSTHHTDECDLWNVAKGLLIAKPTTSALQSFSSICAGTEGLLCSLSSLGLRFLGRW